MLKFLISSRLGSGTEGVAVLETVRSDRVADLSSTILPKVLTKQVLFHHLIRPYLLLKTSEGLWIFAIQHEHVCVEQIER